jgi:hypothetical protein
VITSSVKFDPILRYFIRSMVEIDFLIISTQFIVFFIVLLQTRMRMIDPSVIARALELYCDYCI